MKQNIKNLACAGAFLALGFSALGDTIYDTSASYNGNAFSLTSNQEIGNEIILNSGIWSLTSFTLTYMSPSATLSTDVSLKIRLYENDGVAYNGYASPGTLIYDSDWYNTTLFGSLLANGTHTVTYTGADFPTTIILPADFTFSVTFKGLDGSNQVELPLASNPTAGVSATFGDYWFNSGSGWSLLTNSAAKNNLMVTVTANEVPEPSLIYLGIAGTAMLLGARKLKRKA